jgi:hypothetical protein
MISTNLIDYFEISRIPIEFVRNPKVIFIKFIIIPLESLKIL